MTSDSLNKIYKTLLPGTMAKLEQIDNYDLMKGVHLRVAFNGIWKKSLAELSGGQSSLLALSLILALLRYKPAPIYIFDEIDAALDLSHTANLGLMLKQEFPESQFVVISLKDGMFSNANVLYRVSYVDGSSKVERLTKSTDFEVRKVICTPLRLLTFLQNQKRFLKKLFAAFVFNIHFQ